MGLVGVLKNTLLFPLAFMIRGTTFMSCYHRLLGSKIGRNVVINSPLVRPSALVTIGDNVVIDDFASIDTHIVDDDLATVTTKRVILGPGTRVG